MLRTEITEEMLPNGIDTNALDAFIEYCGNDYETPEELIEAFEENYAGEFSSQSDFAQDFCDGTGMLSEMPEMLRGYFDYDAFGRDLLMGDYWQHNGYYFRSY
jgi:antirestriction protein